MVHMLLFHILWLRSGIDMPVFRPDPWFIVVIIVLKSCTWLNTGLTMIDLDQPSSTNININITKY